MPTEKIEPELPERRTCRAHPGLACNHRPKTDTDLEKARRDYSVSKIGLFSYSHEGQPLPVPRWRLENHAAYVKALIAAEREDASCKRESEHERLRQMESYGIVSVASVLDRLDRERKDAAAKAVEGMHLPPGECDCDLVCETCGRDWDFTGGHPANRGDGTSDLCGPVSIRQTGQKCLAARSKAKG